MRDSILLKLCAKSIGFFMAFYIPVASSDCNIRVRVVEYPPQYSQGSDGKWRGLSIDLARALLDEAGCLVTYKPLPWKRALYLMENGGVDMMLNMSITPERKEFLHFIGPLRDETMVLTVAKESQYNIRSFTDIKDLPKRIGLLRGAFYGDNFQNLLEKDVKFHAQFERADSTKVNITKLINQRIIGFVTDSYNAAYIIRQQLPRAKYKQHSFVFNQSFVYFGLSKKSVSTAVLQKLQSAYTRIQAKGVIDGILSNYK